MLDNSDQVNVVVVDKRVVQFLSCILTCLYWSIHCIYVIQRRCRQIFPETAMQLIYCKCRSVSFWIYIFLNSISRFQHKGETKVDVLSIIYVACWNVFWCFECLLKPILNLLKYKFLFSTTIISLLHCLLACRVCAYPGLLFTGAVVPSLSDFSQGLWVTGMSCCSHSKSQGTLHLFFSL